jgi:glucan 1,3-beta-glucosidase
MGPSLDMATVKQFYMDGWGNLKDSNVAITFHEAFKGVSSWSDWGAGMHSLLLDTHHYEVFDNSIVAQSIDTHIKTACDFGNQMASTGKWTISGEWTGGITDCAKWLNGKNKGARYDGSFDGASKIGECTGKSTGRVADLSQADKSNIGRFIEAQLTAYEKATGWIFWTWKTEGAPEWDMKDLLANGLFPSPVGDLSKRKCKSISSLPILFSSSVSSGCSSTNTTLTIFQTKASVANDATHRRSHRTSMSARNMLLSFRITSHGGKNCSSSPNQNSSAYAAMRGVGKVTT